MQNIENINIYFLVPWCDNSDLRDATEDSGGEEVQDNPWPGVQVAVGGEEQPSQHHRVQDSPGEQMPDSYRANTGEGMQRGSWEEMPHCPRESDRNCPGTYWVTIITVLLYT